MFIILFLCMLVFVINIVTTVLSTYSYYIRRCEFVKSNPKLIGKFEDDEKANNTISAVTAAIVIIMTLVIIIFEFSSGSDTMAATTALLLFTITWNITIFIAKRRKIVMEGLPYQDTMENELTALLFSSLVTAVGTVLFCFIWLDIIILPCNTEHVQADTFNIVEFDAVIAEDESKVNLLNVGNLEYKLYYEDDQNEAVLLTVSSDDATIHYIAESEKAYIEKISVFDCGGYNRSTLKHMVEDDIISEEYNIYIQPNSVLEISY